MTSADGLTLYGFVNDVDAISTCYSTCADAWPPVIVDADWAVGPGLDTGVFSTTERDDGTLQLVAGKFPLYTYGGDAAPGDTTGQGSGDVWFAMNLDGTLISEAAATTASTPADDAAPADPYASEGDAAPARPRPRPPRRRPPTPRPPISIAVDAISATSWSTPTGMTVYGFTNDERRHADLRGRLRRGVAAGHRRRRRAPRRPRPEPVLGRRAPRRHDAAEGRQVAAVPVRR